MTYDQDLLNVVVLTVGTDHGFNTKLMTAVGTRAWGVTTFHLDTYISNVRRPSIGPRIKSAAACIAFIDYDQSPDEAVETTRYLTQVFPGKAVVIAVAQRPTSTAILSAMRAGCTEFVSIPLNMVTLDGVFDRAESMHVAEQEHLAQRGSVQAILGAKGGAGATTLAVHLGVYLAHAHGKNTLLIDQHVELGHACVYLGIDGGGHHLSEVVRNLGRMDSELLQGFVAKHKSGLDVLSSPDSRTASPFHPDDLANTMEFLRGEYDYVVVDCDRTHPELNGTFVDAATQLYVVGTPDIASIRDLSRGVDKLLLVEAAADKIQVVINRFNTPHAISIEQIERAIRLPVSLKIPNEFPGLVRSANVGEPIMPDESNPLSDAFANWADAVVGTPAQRHPKKGDRKLFTAWRQATPAW
jgi:pilus assembly protein CpaE